MLASLRLLAVAIIFAASSVFADEPGIHAGYKKTSFAYKTADGTERTRTLHLWYPTSVEAKVHNYRGQNGVVAVEAAILDKKNPVVVFSHGFLGAGDQTIFVMEELARKGFIVAASNHADSLAEMKFGQKGPGIPNFADAKSWTDAKFRDRKDDVSALLDFLFAENLRAGSPFHKRLDEKAIGGVGHSLGGYTMLGLAGAWPSWRDERIGAFVLWSPYALPHLAKDHLAGIKRPVMLQGGTFDFGITPFLPKLYDGLASPKSSLVLKNETHFGWTNLLSFGRSTTDAVKSGNAQLITEYTIGFLDRHVRGLPAGVLEKKSERLESYVFQGK